jgi:hypothetical protein
MDGQDTTFKNRVLSLSFKVLFEYFFKEKSAQFPLLSLAYV